MKKWYRIAAVVVVMVAVIAMVIISGVRRSGESEYTRNTITRERLRHLQCMEAMAVRI